MTGEIVGGDNEAFNPQTAAAAAEAMRGALDNPAIGYDDALSAAENAAEAAGADKEAAHIAAETLAGVTPLGRALLVLRESGQRRTGGETQGHPDDYGY